MLDFSYNLSSNFVFAFFLLMTGIFLPFFFFFWLLGWIIHFYNHILFSTSLSYFLKCSIVTISHLYHGCNVFSYSEVFLNWLFPLFPVFVFYTERFLQIWDALHLLMGLSLVAPLVKNPPAMQETWVQSLGWEDPLEKGKANHSSILASRIPWTVQSMGSQRVGNDSTTFTCLFYLLVYLRLRH